MRHSRLCFDSIVLLGHGRDETVGHRPGQHFTDGGHERLLSLLRPDQNHHAGLSGTQRANRLPGRSQKIRSFLFDANFERPTGEVAQESRAGLHVGPIGQQLIGSGDADDHRQRFRHVHHDGVREIVRSMRDYEPVPFLFFYIFVKKFILLIVIIYEPYRLQSEVIILIFRIAHYC